MMRTTNKRAGVIEDSLRTAVRWSMKSRGWTVCRTARHAGIARSTLGHWLKGQRRIGSRELAAVIDALGARLLIETP